MTPYFEPEPLGTVLSAMLHDPIMMICVVVLAVIGAVYVVIRYVIKWQ